MPGRTATRLRSGTFALSGGIVGDGTQRQPVTLLLGSIDFRASTGCAPCASSARSRGAAGDGHQRRRRPEPTEGEEARMAARKQQTHAKRARELAVKERRERKLAKRAEAAARRAAGADAATPDGDAPEAGGQAEAASEWIR